MTTWIKIDVQGDLQPIVCKARGKVAQIYRNFEEDLFITSQREGLHSIISLHPDGWAFDCLKPKVGLPKIVQDIKDYLGPDFDVVDEKTHLHIEYDPKIVRK